MAVWAGVDVGAQRKGFHVAAVDEQRVVHGPVNVASVAAATELLVSLGPVVIGIDSPCGPAPPGSRSRPCERDLAGAVCGIRYTPDADALVSGGRYYAWIRNGLALYAALAAVGAGSGAGFACRVVEVFPTASWTRLYGPRGSLPRGAWSNAALESLGLEGLPARRLSQDDRDAVAAAWTARLCSLPSAIQWFGEIAVPGGHS